MRRRGLQESGGTSGMSKHSHGFGRGHTKDIPGSFPDYLTTESLSPELAEGPFRGQPEGQDAGEYIHWALAMEATSPSKRPLVKPE